MGIVEQWCPPNTCQSGQDLLEKNDHVGCASGALLSEDLPWVWCSPKEYILCPRCSMVGSPPALGLSTPGLDHSASTLLIKAVMEKQHLAKARNQNCSLFCTQGKRPLYSSPHLPVPKWWPESKDVQEHRGEAVPPAHTTTHPCVVKWGDIQRPHQASYRLLQLCSYLASAIGKVSR